MEQKKHEMILELTHVSGMQGWYCPTCGRRILLQVPPNEQMLIVEVGNTAVTHSGSSGGLHIGAIELSQQDNRVCDISDESLRPWIKALEALDLDW
jgi:hypothetical protein